MSFSFDPDIKERVRTATDIVELVGSRLELRRQGAMYVANCPWHNDSRPSLQVNPARQTWKCWVCDIGGDVFNYVMRIEGCSFADALHRLAERAGINMARRGASGKSGRGGQDATVDQKAELYRVLRWADDFFHRYLLESPQAAAARDYLNERGITHHSQEKFHLGMSPNSWSALLEAAAGERISPTLLEAAGLVVKREGQGGYYDRFRERIIFPIRDRENRTIAFGGRIMPGAGEGAKYINSPETRLFQKSRQLYGFDVAHIPIHRQRQAVVMEGYTDVIVAHQVGVDNAVAVLGTALGAAHLRTLRHSCDSVVLLLDGDEAGQRRSDEVLELFLHAQLDVRIVTLPEGLDPADYLNKYGLEAFERSVATACDALEFRLRRATAGIDPLVDTHRVHRAIEEMLSLLAKVPHSGLISNEAFRIRQNQVLTRLSRQFTIGEEVLRQQLSALRQRQSQLTQSVRSRAQEPQETAPPIAFHLSDLSPFERELLELLIIAPQVAPIVLERVQSGWLECKAARAMLDAYQQLDFSGVSLEFNSVLSAVEDPSLKSLLVTLHDQAAAKSSSTKASADERLRALTQRIGQRHDELRGLQLVEQLRKGVSEKEEMDLLQDVIRQARLRQGLQTAALSADPAVPSQPEQDSDVPASR
ncbi:MAG: DNA primase [Pirellulaceae bacterium]|nr:DNA primase [Pirellulaceae bacterium]